MSRRYTLTFESFRIAFPQRTLSCDDHEIKLGSRALEILVALAEAAGELVSNQALVARVWPNTIVDEGSLRVHMSALRKALEAGGCGGRLIVNEMGRGYRLAATVKTETTPENGAQSLAVTEAMSFAAALYVERALAFDNLFQISNANLTAVCTICRQRDGMPLTIEMAAAARIASMDATMPSTHLVEAGLDDECGVNAEQSLRRALAVAIKQGAIAWADMIEGTLELSQNAAS
jgi:DNA-binding winged helix-turn-helix (wHTH) protein